MSCWLDTFLQELCFLFPISIFYPEEVKTRCIRFFMLYRCKIRQEAFHNKTRFNQDSRYAKLRNKKKIELSSQPEDFLEYSRDLQYLTSMFHNRTTSKHWSFSIQYQSSVNLNHSYNILTTSGPVYIYLTQIVWTGLRNPFSMNHLVASSPHYLCKGELMQEKINCEFFWKPNGYKFF